jgi:hypothetical protein
VPALHRRCPNPGRGRRKLFCFNGLRTSGGAGTKARAWRPGWVPAAYDAPGQRQRGRSAGDGAAVAEIVPEADAELGAGRVQARKRVAAPAGAGGRSNKRFAERAAEIAMMHEFAEKMASMAVRCTRTADGRERGLRVRRASTLFLMKPSALRYCGAKRTEFAESGPRATPRPTTGTRSQRESPSQIARDPKYPGRSRLRRRGS